MNDYQIDRIIMENIYRLIAEADNSPQDRGFMATAGAGGNPISWLKNRFVRNKNKQAQPQAGQTSQQPQQQAQDMQATQQQAQSTQSGQQPQQQQPQTGQAQQPQKKSGWMGAFKQLSQEDNQRVLQDLVNSAGLDPNIASRLGQLLGVTVTAPNQGNPNPSQNQVGNGQQPQANTQNTRTGRQLNPVVNGTPMTQRANVNFGGQQQPRTNQQVNSRTQQNPQVQNSQWNGQYTYQQGNGQQSGGYTYGYTQPQQQPQQRANRYEDYYNNMRSESRRRIDNIIQEEIERFLINEYMSDNLHNAGEFMAAVGRHTTSNLVGRKGREVFGRLGNVLRQDHNTQQQIMDLRYFWIELKSIVKGSQSFSQDEVAQIRKAVKDRIYSLKQSMKNNGYGRRNGGGVNGGPVGKIKTMNRNAEYWINTLRNSGQLASLTQESRDALKEMTQAYTTYQYDRLIQIWNNSIVDELRNMGYNV